MSRQTPHPDSNLRDILEYLRKDADNYGRMDERIDVLETSISKLERILLDGSGEQAALIHQILEIKFNLKGLKETVTANELKIQNSMRQRAQITTAIIIALIAAVASMVSAYISMRGR